ncbi:basic helix-loop-helix protein A isoform X2 [Amborella trichopoda]|uniref:basic helix-loop-helix protein A isoform X2 n=1 Tax=Amborella trichopoda TaxID=13333 RepID=UPI0005D3E9AF|nr:basic helix-loop-helix protein A isoform X2 [Amborella trichopoda]|eukprot:XP_011625677.1 basic helix-loop-helix protein A isoform X2 [Amborella trichopoda]
MVPTPSSSSKPNWSMATAETPALSSAAAQLQRLLQLAVQSVQWTYSVFWQICPQQGVLIWGDGYYNGAIKTRKTVQPMEVNAEEVCLQRSQQLRELYDSLSAGETNQPSKRPCAALSPEDLTESEWFYLMCISFTFPLGIGIPGRAASRRHYIWLTGANEEDSKVFTRAILAKSAHIQTIVCIPVMDGVLELGTTERVQEDSSMVQQLKALFMDDQGQLQPQKPVHSEHSTSKPATSTDSFPYHRDHHRPHRQHHHQQHQHHQQPHDQQQEQPPLPWQAVEIEEEGDGESESESEREMQTKDIQVGLSPEGCSDPNPINMTAHTSLTNPPCQEQHLPMPTNNLLLDDTNPWPLLHDDISIGLPSSGATMHRDDMVATQEDGHYSKTVAAVLQRNNTNNNAAPPFLVTYSCQFPKSEDTVFSKWKWNNQAATTTSQGGGGQQWLLKYILFSVPFLHSKYRDENSPKARGDGESGSRLRRGVTTPQDELSANHVLAERRRREKLNERFIILRSLVPFVTKMDKASILGDTIEYVKQLRKRIQDLESRNRQMEINLKTRASVSSETQKLSSTKDRTNSNTSAVLTTAQTLNDRSRTMALDKRKRHILEGARTKMAAGGCITDVQVSIIESDALLELQCPYRNRLLLEIMQTLNELHFETQSVQSSSDNGVLIAEFRAKVKENPNGEKVTLVEAKQAIHHILENC